MGYITTYSVIEKPYWAGYCDIKDGFECSTAEELLTAPIYDGKSIRDRWNDVVIITIGGIPLEEWMEGYRAN